MFTKTALVTIEIQACSTKFCEKCILHNECNIIYKSLNGMLPSYCSDFSE